MNFLVQKQLAIKIFGFDLIKFSIQLYRLQNCIIFQQTCTKKFFNLKYLLFYPFKLIYRLHSVKQITWVLCFEMNFVCTWLYASICTMWATIWLSSWVSHLMPPQGIVIWSCILTFFTAEWFFTYKSWITMKWIYLNYTYLWNLYQDTINKMKIEKEGYEHHNF